MRRRPLMLLTVAAVATLTFGDLVGPAGSAGAHEFEADGNVTIGVDPEGRVDPGTRLVFEGSIRGVKTDCRRGRSVELIEKGSGVVDTARSRPDGDYKMALRIEETGRFQVLVPADVSGVHPHRHVCLSIRSRTIRVRVG